MSFQSLYRFFAFGVVLACVTVPLAAETAETGWRAVPIGVAAVDITPETPVRMYGYASRKTESEGIAGRLAAKALVIGDDAGDGPAVLLTVDCGSVPVRIREEVLRRVREQVPLRPERFVLSNSHNHSGPNLKGMGSMSGQQYEHLARYARQLTDRLASVILTALDSRQPAHLAWTQGSVDFAANRRVLKDGQWTGFGAVPDAPVDHSLPLLRITGSDGQLLAVVVNYACHCTTLRGDFQQIHGDWAACAQQYLEEALPGTTALITIGCGADSDPCPHGTVELCQQHGRAVANEVKRLLEGPFRPIQPDLTSRSVTLQIPYQPAPSLEQLRQQAEGSHAVRSLVQRLERGQSLPQAEGYGITVWAFGDDLAMIFLADEVVVDYVLRLKQEMDGRRLWVTAYANEVSRYIVSRRLVDEGGYEVNNSLSFLLSHGQPERLKPTVEQRIVAAVNRLLPESYRKP
jgi:hypothetical protein